ncbi:MAG: hypothetical protein ACT4QC_13960 [Planctomycetaceae bacterium]
MRRQQPLASPNAGPATRFRSRSRGSRLPQSRSRKVLFLSIYALFCAALLWSAGRVYSTWRTGVPITAAATVWDLQYPELRTSGLLAAQVRHDDDRFDVLLLGGSALEPAWGSVERHLETRLRATLGDWFRLFNLAKSAHTSRDSFLKYSHLDDQQFDLVVVYDGINDARMNNIAAEHFRDDYTHCSWYRSFERRLRTGVVWLPLEDLAQRADTLYESIGLGEPDAHQLQYGCDLKTPGPFRSNHQEILRIAGDRNDKVLLATYAYHLPVEGLEPAIAAAGPRSAPDDVRRCPIEMWGRAECVRACLDVQNAGIRALAAAHPEVLPVDQQRLLQGAGLFVDACHLTETGSARFVENLWPEVHRCIRDWEKD